MGTTLNRGRRMLSKSEHRQAMYDLSIAHVTSPAELRMRHRTAKEQHAAALEALKGPEDLPVPDSDADANTRAGVLS